ncbi:hypothetical protein CARUB_v10026680mg [Capsella rubella]|uniref:U-box domain-containing protein n=1 Tax=Capsella rubella TaxID=81985 RepID=R0GR17_9BRAS|nr:U-box domain-containing protein 4 [Capsella rubella]EOA13613.1 hypothetical protein CARUB_v10026680mg [Capsella rubella]
MENYNSFTYLDHSNFINSSLNEDSSVFSDCKSDRSGEFQTMSPESRRGLFLSCAIDNSDDLIRYLVTHLESSSSSIEEQKQAAMEIRILSKDKPENRIKLGKAGAIKPLISLISSSDPQLQEYGVTAVLNLSLCDENKDMIVSSGAINSLVKALRLGTPTTKENAACALLRLSQSEDNKTAIGRSGAIPLLVNLLENGGFRAKKDASTALYSLCSTKENKLRAVESGIMKPLVELMADFESEMVDKSAFVMNLLMSEPESKPAVVEEGGVPVLVEIVEAGTQRQKEMATSILLKLCEESVVYRTMVAREGAVPPLVALSQSSSSSRAKLKAEALITLLRQPRQQQHFESNENER